jgi:SAM-dependent methyltransferase
MDMAQPNHSYLLNTALPAERARLAAVQAELDPGTIRYLERLGVGAGHRCLEVGGGAGSIAAWLSARVGSTGSVTATDIEPIHLTALARERSNVEPLRHDILVDPLPEAAFDFVHVRWLLHHLVEPQRALAAMARALKPGGWLLAEELDLGSIALPEDAPEDWKAVVQRFVGALSAMLAKRGGSYRYGRQLLAHVRATEVVDVEGEGRVSLGCEGTALTTNLRFTIQILRDALAALGLFSSDDADALFALTSNPAFVWMGYTTIAVWGRRSAGVTR